MNEEKRISDALAKIARRYKLKRMKNGKYKEEEVSIPESQHGYDIKASKDESTTVGD